MKKSIMFTLGLAALFCAACVDNSTNGSGGGEVDALLEKYNNPNGGSRGGGSACKANFKSKQIGTQTWMTENLNCDAAGGVCYDNDPTNCTKYGRLYTWEEAISACPAGWHLPDSAEWETLVGFAGYSYTKLKAGSGWYDNGNGTDDYEFAALPGGRGGGGDFSDAGLKGYWWSATEDDAWNALYRYMYYNDFPDPPTRIPGIKYSQFSVRCVQD